VGDEVVSHFVCLLGFVGYFDFTAVTRKLRCPFRAPTY
jgi:hypothetical protein